MTNSDSWGRASNRLDARRFASSPVEAWSGSRRYRFTAVADEQYTPPVPTIRFGFAVSSAIEK